VSPYKQTVIGLVVLNMVLPITNGNSNGIILSICEKFSRKYMALGVKFEGDNEVATYVPL